MTRQTSIYNELSSLADSITFNNHFNDVPSSCYNAACMLNAQIHQVISVASTVLALVVAGIQWCLDTTE